MPNGSNNPFNKLAVKIGSLIILAELVVLIVTGFFYISSFSAEVDRRIEERVLLPGSMMRTGLLTFDSVADQDTMKQIVGEQLLNGMVVGINRVVFYSSNADSIGKEIIELPGVATELFSSELSAPQVVERPDRIISISPIFGADGRTLRFFAYVEASTTDAQAEKSRILQQFVVGTLVTLFATSLIIFFAFNFTLLRRIQQVLAVLKQVEAGNLSARLKGAQSSDEMGTLQAGVNSMIVQLQSFIATLEQRIQARTQELEVARTQAVEASNAKSVFLSNMSHELRTPLNMVIGYTSSMLNMPQMYKNQPLPDIFRPDVELIQQNGEHLLGLINDILDLSKIEASKLDLHRAAIDLLPIFEGVLATANGLLKEKPVQLRPDYQKSLPLVWADSLRIRQVLLNLVSNAIKFTETGSVTLSAHVSGTKLRIAITDTGIGIPEKALKTIFDRFEQIKSNVQHGGTGLGLDISQRLCQMHGSTLTVESTMGQGSTFAFELVLATPEQIASGVAPQPQFADGGIKVFGGAAQPTQHPIETVLLVEDDATLRTALRTALEAANYVVIDTHDGQQLMDLATGVIPNLIVLDADLPDSDPRALLSSLKADPDTTAIPVVAMVTAIDQRLETQVLTQVQKPVDPATFAAKLRQLRSEATPITSSHNLTQRTITDAHPVR
jgi:signal transduction histidine kinase/ActR/RegA family two-component response regulator